MATVEFVVIVADEVQDAVHNDAVQFIGKLGSVERSILLYGIDGDEQVSGEPVSLTIVESDDVCEIVMLKVTHVHIEDVVVGTEYYVNVSDGFDFAASDHFQPTVVRLFVLENKLYILAIIPDHDQKFPQIYNY